MIDISMQGATMTFSNSMLKGNVVLEFGDEGTPVEFPDLAVCGYSMTMNGVLVTWTKPTPITFSLTVIPGSKSDRSLRNLLLAGHVGGKQGKAIDQQSVYIGTCTLQTPAITTDGGVVKSSGNQKFIFSNGRLSDGNPANGFNAEGKASARTYKFVFESAKYA